MVAYIILSTVGTLLSVILIDVITIDPYSILTFPYTCLLTIYGWPFIMVELTGEGRACIPVGLTKT